MKKPTLIIGKKQVILSCLTLMLAVAVYVNYSMSKDDRNLTTAESGVHTYGETEFVNAKAAKTTEVATDAAQEETTAVQECPCIVSTRYRGRSSRYGAAQCR